MKRLDIPPGSTFNDLEVVTESETESGKRYFRCRCECGRFVVVRLDHLRSGHTSSCGRCGLEHKGERRTVREWASLYGIKESTLRARLKVMELSEALERG